MDKRKLRMIKPIIKATNSRPLDKDEAKQIKFSLYLKNRKVKEISKIMDQVLLWPKKSINKWSKDFSPEISDMLEDLLDEAANSFDGVTLDKELMELFAEFTQNLKTVTRQIHGVIINNKPIDA